MAKKKIICLLIVTAAVLLHVHGDDRLELVIGPRVGVTYINAIPAEFNTSLQTLFPATRTYFPIITQFGVDFEQRIRLGGTQSHFVFQEVLVFGGLDQNFILPSLSTLIGFRSHAGLEIGLGPNFTLKSENNRVVIAMSVVYALGWTFSFQDVYVPVNIAVVPTPADGHLRVGLLTGFNFAID